MTRDSLSFQEITLLAAGHTSGKVAKDRFFRTLSDLEIIVKDTDQRLARSHYSKDNYYQPIRISEASKQE